MNSDDRRRAEDELMDEIPEKVEQHAKEIAADRAGRPFARPGLTLDMQRSFCHTLGRRVKVVYESDRKEMDEKDKEATSLRTLSDKGETIRLPGCYLDVFAGDVRSASGVKKYVGSAIGEVSLKQRQQNHHAANPNTDHKSVHVSRLQKPGVEINLRVLNL